MLRNIKIVISHGVVNKNDSFDGANIIHLKRSMATVPQGG